MRHKKESLGIGCAATRLGVIPGVFIMGLVVFADGAPILSSEQLLPVILNYVILGSIGGAISAWPRATVSTWRIVIWFTLPGFGMVFFMGKNIGLLFSKATSYALEPSATKDRGCAANYGSHNPSDYRGWSENTFKSYDTNP